MLHAAHHYAHPVVGLVDDAGRGIQQVVFREQPVDIVDAVAQLIDLALLHAGVVEGRLQGAAGLCTLDDAVDVVDAVLQHGLLARILVENIVLHVAFILLVFAAVTVLLFQSETHQCMAAFLLLVGHAVVDLFERLTVGFLGHLAVLLVVVGVGQYGLLQRVALRVHAMFEAQTARVVKDKGFAALIVHIVSAVLHHFLNERAGVATCQYEAQFPDDAVFHHLSGLLQTVGPDGKSVQVAVLHALLGRLAGGRVVELGVSVDPALAVFQQCVADDIVKARVIVVVHHRHSLATAALECVFCNGQTVVTLGVRLRRPAAAVVVKIHHFDFSFLLRFIYHLLHSLSPSCGGVTVNLCRLSRVGEKDSCSAAGLPWGLSRVSFR